MKTFFKLAPLILFLSPALAMSDELNPKDFTQLKTKILADLKTRRELMNAFIDCVEKTSSPPDIKICHGNFEKQNLELSEKPHK